MAHNPHAPQGQDPAQDPAGSTQMFRAFVEEGSGGSGAAGRSAPQAASNNSRTGLVLGVVAAVVVVVGAVLLAVN